MTFLEFKEIIDSVNPLTVSLQGWGESLLNKELFKMVEYLETSKKIRVGFNTNLTLVKGNIDSIINSKLSRLTLSVDNANEEKNRTYEIKSKSNKSVFTKYRFDELLAGARQLVDARSDLSLDHPVIQMDVTVTDDNINELDKLVELGKEILVDQINFHCVTVYDKNIESTYVPVKEVEDRLQGYRREEKQKKRPHPKINVILPPKESSVCKAPWTSIFVTQEGDVWPCCHRYDKRMGNMKRTSLKQIWNSEEYGKFRRELVEGKDEICRRCEDTQRVWWA
jgi:radical SAM protein with 4Fe4S-binding SPASM domain